MVESSNLSSPYYHHLLSPQSFNPMNYYEYPSDMVKHVLKFHPYQI